MFFVVDFSSLLIFSIFLPLFVHLLYILFLKFYLFIWLHRVLVIAFEVFNWSTWTLSCSMWDVVPWPGIEPRPPALGVQSLSRWTTRKVLYFLFQCPCLLTSIFDHLCAVPASIVFSPLSITFSCLFMSYDFFLVFWTLCVKGPSGLRQCPLFPGRVRLSFS